MRMGVSIAAAILMMATVSCNAPFSGDAYLRTVRIKSESLTAIDSVDLDRYGIFMPRDVVDAGDGWIVISSSKSNWHLLFLNPETGEHFQAIRKGRGPGEIVSGSSLHSCGKEIRYYDFTGGRCVALRLGESVRARSAVCDTVADFRSGERPAFMCSCWNGHFVSGRAADGNVWYSLYDSSGKVLSEVPALSHLPVDRDRAASVMMSSKYAASEDGHRICVANVVVPALSFAAVSDDGLKEYRRVQIRTDIAEALHIKDAVSRFNGVCADDDNVYVIYSGRRLLDKSCPAHECSHLLVYDWNGDVRHHYLLEHPVSAISLSGGVLYAVSGYPSGMLYRFSPGR